MGERNGVIGGVSNIVAVEFKPWWEGVQGTVDVIHVDGRTLSPREAFELTLDWQVVERPMFVDVGIDDEPQKLVTVPNKKALVRTDTRFILGDHSDSYGLIQNEIMCEFMEAIKIVGNDVEMVSSGELFGGPVVWMLAKLGTDKHFIDRGERLARYFAVSNSFDGSAKFRCTPTDTRIECMNTFAMHLGETADIELRHTSKVDERLALAKLTIDALYAHSAELDAEIEQLLSMPFADSEYERLVVADLNPKPAVEDGIAIPPRKLTNWMNRQEAFLNAYKRPDQENIKGTAWGAIMAVNSYENWAQRIKKGSRSENQAVKALRGNYPLTARARQLVTN